MKRPYNFSAGPATMPEAVLQTAAHEMLDWHGTGMGVMEMSHRGQAFLHIATQAEADLRSLLSIPDDFAVLFMQGGGLAENAIVPLNLSQGGAMDFVLTGSWSQKSWREAGKYGQARVAASAEASGFTTLPDPSQWHIGADTRYVHVCANETIHGVEYPELPDLQALGCTAPLVVDCSSNIASRPIDWSRVGLAFAGAQKNLGPAGLTLVVVRRDLIGHALPHCPSAFDYRLVADNGSMYNTPPTYAIYMAGLVFRWLLDQGGLAAIEAQNRLKAERLYHCIDRSSLYHNPVDPACRSRMNIPFFLRDPARNADFLAGAEAAGLLQLKGHKSLGGMRASLYNAMPIEGVDALIEYLREFERTQA